MKNNRLISIILLYLLSCCFAGCRCHSYFSNSKSLRIEGKLFDIKCNLLPRYTQDSAHLEVAIYIKDSLNRKSIKESLVIYPVISGDEKSDTLKLASVDGRYYSFGLHTKSKSNLDLFLNFKVDSSGVLVNKSVEYKNLEKIEDCKFSLMLH
ncbi:MAG: hypothetical protein V4642_14240 [Bacteroidota bacterium]